MKKLLKRHKTTGKHVGFKPHKHRKHDCIVCALDATNERLLVM